MGSGEITPVFKREFRYANRVVLFACDFSLANNGMRRYNSGYWFREGRNVLYHTEKY